MQEYNISQLPVIEDSKIVGSLNEESVMKLLHDGINFQEQKIGAVMGKPLPSLDDDDRYLRGFPAPARRGRRHRGRAGRGPRGVITRSDLVSFWMRQEKPDEV